MGIQSSLLYKTHIARKFNLLLPIPYTVGDTLRLLKRIHTSFVTEVTYLLIVMGRRFCHVILLLKPSLSGVTHGWIQIQLYIYFMWLLFNSKRVEFTCMATWLL